MNEMNPRMKRKSPLPFTKGEPRVVYRTNWVVVTPWKIVLDFSSSRDWSDLHTRETSTKQAKKKSKKTESKELCFHFHLNKEMKESS